MDLPVIQILGTALLTALFTPPVFGTIYYVDYALGDDSSSGLSPHTAFGHSPGDPQATGIAGNLTLKPGDKVLFKGSVAYRGTITTIGSGTADAPIVYDGNISGEFGPGPAIVDGSEHLLGWEKCGVAAGAAVVCAMIPPEAPETLVLVQDGVRIPPAQLPKPTNPYAPDNVDLYFAVEPSAVDATNITAPAILNRFQGPWNGARVLAWGYPNTVYEREIHAFDPESGSIRFDAVPFYDDRPARFAIINHSAALTRFGEFVFDEETRVARLISRGRSGSSPGSILISQRRFGIEIRHPYIHVQGFIVQNHVGEPGDHRGGAGIRVTGGDPNEPLKGVRIVGNDVLNNYSAEQQGAITAFNTRGILIEQNRVHHNAPNRGILVQSSEGAVTRGNTLRSNGGTAIAHFNSLNGAIIENVIEEVLGNHSNGVSVYLGSHGTMVCGNRVEIAAIALTVKHTRDILVAYNTFSSRADNFTVADWGEGGGARYHNNVMRNSYRKALYIQPSSMVNVEVSHNIIDGSLSSGPPGRFYYNAYTSLAWNQHPKHGWMLGEGEFVLEADENLETDERDQPVPAPEWPAVFRKTRHVDVSTCGASIEGEHSADIQDRPRSPEIL